MPQLDRISQDCPQLGLTHDGSQQNGASDRSSPQEFVPEEVEPQQITQQPVISQEAILVLQEPSLHHLLPPVKCVYRRTRDHAKQFAQSMMATCFASGSDTRQIFWTDASLKKENQHDHHHGGIAVAQLSDDHWTVQHAHVIGLTKAYDLEALAVMMALESLLHDGPAQLEEVLIFCDSQQVLEGLEKTLAPFPAMQYAVQVYESTRDHRHALASFWESYDFGRIERPDGSLSPIWERTLAAYYQLLERGTSVQFHWVPGHEEILGNDVADQWACYARCWYMNFATTTGVSSSDVMVFPLVTVQLECNHLGLPITGEKITEIQARENLEVSKGLRYSLSTSSRLGEAFTSIDRAVPVTAVVQSTIPHNKIAARPLQLDEDEVQTTVHQTEAAVQKLARKRRKRRQCHKGGRRDHAAAHCEQRTLRASCGLKDNSHTEDECYTTQSTPFNNVLSIVDCLRRQVSRWQAWSFWSLLIEVIIGSILMLLIYIYTGGLSWLALGKAVTNEAVSIKWDLWLKDEPRGEGESCQKSRSKSPQRSSRLGEDGRDIKAKFEEEKD